MSQDDDVYFEYQRQLAKLLNCVSHPSSIAAAIRSLQERAEVGDQKRNQRTQFITDQIRLRLMDIGITEGDLSSVADDIAKVARNLASITGDLADMRRT